MSDSDSFIDEVADAVRRDQLFVYLRRYGWIAVLCVLALVGGAAYNEVRKANATADAQATGDALMEALSLDDPTARSAAMTPITVDGPGAAVAALWAAAMQQEAGENDAAAQTLAALAVDGEVPAIYRDLAAFKAAMLPSDDIDARIQALDALSQPGQPFRLLALEQLAHIDVAAGNTDDAVATLRAILEDAAVTRSLQERAQTLIVALGAPLDAVVTQ